MSELLFVYGTLKNPDVQKEVIGRAVKTEQDILSGYKKTKILVQGEVYPAIVNDDKGKVYGNVLFIDKDDLDKIDDYETTAYRRARVRLESGRDAWVYIRA